MPGIHEVTSSRDIIGGDLSQGTFFTTTEFAEANPTTIKAIREATADAIAYIKRDPKGALEDYKTISGDKTSIDDLMAILKEPQHVLKLIPAELNTGDFVGFASGFAVASTQMRKACRTPYSSGRCW